MKLNLLIYFAVFVYGIPETMARGKSLRDELHDFTNILPIEKILELGVRYEKTDTEFQNLVEHVKSREFWSFLDKLSKIKEYKELVSYLNINGIVDGRMIQNMNYPQVLQFQFSKQARIARSYDQFLDDVESLLFVEKARDMFRKKIESSVAFRNFYEVVIGKDFQNLLEEVLNLDAVQNEKAILENFGVDFKHLVKICKEIFGFP